MGIGNIDVGMYKVISASGNITGKNAGGGALRGIWVSAASATPTITVYDDPLTGTTTPIVTVFTPAPSTWYTLPFSYTQGLNIVISGTVSATVSYV